jgi:TolB-like protein/DNA-binding winged helix-turn-helix (wHTH) protein
MSDDPIEVDLASERDFTLGPLGVSPSSCRVRVGRREQRVEPRVMQVLVVLARRLGETVTRDQLIEACWGGRAVTDDAVNRVLAQVRALSRTLDPPPFNLETLPRVGVRLILREALGAPLAERSRGQRFGWVAAGAAVLLLVTLGGWVLWRGARVREPPVVAVLPFANASNDPSLAYLGDGIAGDIQAMLAQGRAGVRVIGVASSFQLRGRDQTPSLVRRRLGATHAILGSVQRDTNRVHILAQLVDTRSGEVLWSDTYDRDFANVLDIQADVARRTALVLHLAAPELASDSGPTPPEALENYLRAMQVLRTGVGGLRTFDDVVPPLESATQAAPQFAHAWAALAEAYRLKSRRQGEAEQARLLEQARTAARQALQIDPSLGFAHAVLEASESEWNWDQRLSELARAEALSPNDVDVIRHRAELARRMGRLEDMRNANLRRLQLDPLSPEARDLAWGEMLHRDRGEAEKALRRYVAQDSDANALWIDFVEQAVHAGDRPAAERGMVELERGWPNVRAHFRLSDQTAVAMLANIRRQVSETGRPPDVAAHRAHADAVFQNLRSNGGQGCAADALADLADPAAGRLDLAWQVAEELYLRRGYAVTGGACGHSLYSQRQTATWPLFIPQTESLRRDPRIWRLFAGVGLAQHWLEAGDWPDFCREANLPYDCRREALRATGRASN